MKNKLVSLFSLLTLLFCTSCGRTCPDSSNTQRIPFHDEEKKINSASGICRIDFDGRIYEFEHKGHSYIVGHHYEGGICLIHAEHCECKSK